jgi:hypothetical protein
MLSVIIVSSARWPLVRHRLQRQKVSDTRIGLSQGPDGQLQSLPGPAVILRSLPGPEVVIQGDHPALATHERDIEGLLHSEHVHGLTSIQEQSLARLKGRGSKQTLQARPEGVRDPDIAPELDAVPGDVTYRHPLH